MGGRGQVRCMANTYLAEHLPGEGGGEAGDEDAAVLLLRPRER